MSLSFLIFCGGTSVSVPSCSSSWSSLLLRKGVVGGVLCLRKKSHYYYGNSGGSRRLIGGGGVWKDACHPCKSLGPLPLLSQVKPLLYSTNPSPSSSPVKIKNPRPRGIVPMGEDYGGYDESKHEEFEEQAEKRQQRIRWLKKIGSSSVFLSIFLTVLWARRRKQKEVEEYTRNVKFLPSDYLYQGNNPLCLVPHEEGDTVLFSQTVRDGTLNFIQGMEFRRGDVVVASFPKTGTTWVQEIAYLISTNLDFTKASGSTLEDRFPFLEFPYPGAKSVDKMPSPRHIKTHLPFFLLPNKRREDAKIIYITRNPKDTAVSMYHFVRMLSFIGFIGSFEEFLERFMENKVPYGPYFGHMESYLNHKDDPNLLIISYEDLSRDPSSVIHKISIFLDKPLTPDEIDKLVDHTSFTSMASNPAVNYTHWDALGIRKKTEAQFMRKGKVGDWKNYFSQENNQKFDQWISENNKKFKIKFHYEL